MSSALRSFGETKKRLDSVSPSFCMAKWQQVTMHLHNGTNHSCHHPVAHHVSVEELSDNIHALHNSEFKKEQRKKMLRGERPSECQYCWNIEDSDTSGELYSDRVVKSIFSHWNTPQHFSTIISSNGDEDVYPSYLEVSFSNRCNLKCSYCGPIYSSSWQEELKIHGNYDTESKFNLLESSDLNSTKVDEESPYLIAFKQWWPSAKPHVKVLRITGGEPLLEKTTFALLEDIASSDYYLDIEVSVNSNLSVSASLINKFSDLLGRVSQKVREVRVYTSCEASGEQAEYIRYGLKYETWIHNLDHLMTQNPRVKFTIMTTVNILSTTTILQFCKDMLVLKLKHLNDHRKVALSVSFSILRWPQHQRLDIMTENLHTYFDEAHRYLLSSQEGKNGNDYYRGYFDYEIHAFERVIAFMKGKNSDLRCKNTARRDFYNFFNQHDSRRNTNFVEVFPELVPFRDLCASLVDGAINFKSV